MSYLIPGTVVSVAIGPIKHFGIISDRQGLQGPFIISCSQRTGCVAEEAAQAFANGGNINIHGYPSQLNSYQVLQRARSKLGTKYDLLKWNCEHFVRWTHNLKAESPQLQATAILGVLSLLLFSIARKA
jgi:hypothetical protein